MKNINILNNNDLLLKIVLTPVILYSGYNMSKYILSSDKTKKVDNEVKNEKNIVELNKTKTIKTKIISKKERKELLVEETGNILLQNLKQLKKTHKEFLDKIIINRKIICDKYLDSKLSCNRITINDINRKPEIKSIYVNTIELNDKIVNIFNYIEETIKWIYWFQNEVEIRQVYHKLIYHDKISVMDTFEKMNFDLNYIPSISQKNQILNQLNKLIDNVNNYHNEINLILNVSEYIVRNNTELTNDFKLEEKINSIKQIVNQNKDYFKVDFEKKINDFKLQIEKIDWLNFENLENKKKDYIMSLDENKHFYDFCTE